MNGERFFASSSASIGTWNAGPPTSTWRAQKAGAWPQLTIPPTAPSTADQTRPRPCARRTARPPARSSSARTETGSSRPARRGAGPFAGLELDHRRRTARSMRAPPARKVESRRLPAKAGRPVQFLGRRFCHVFTFRGRGLVVAHAGRHVQCASATLLSSAVTASTFFGGRPAGNRRQGGTARRRRGFGARRSGRRSRGRCRDIRRVRRRLCTSPSRISFAPPSSSRTAVPSLVSIVDRPFLALGPAPVEAGGERAVGLGARESRSSAAIGVCAFCGHAELGRLHEQAARERSSSRSRKR